MRASLSWSPAVLDNAFPNLVDKDVSYTPYRAADEDGREFRIYVSESSARAEVSGGREIWSIQQDGQTKLLTTITRALPGRFEYSGPPDLEAIVYFESVQAAQAACELCRAPAAEQA